MDYTGVMRRQVDRSDFVLEVLEAFNSGGVGSDGLRITSQAESIGKRNRGRYTHRINLFFSYQNPVTGRNKEVTHTQLFNRNGTPPNEYAQRVLEGVREDVNDSGMSLQASVEGEGSLVIS